MVVLVLVLVLVVNSDDNAFLIDDRLFSGVVLCICKGFTKSGFEIACPVLDRYTIVVHTYHLPMIIIYMFIYIYIYKLMYCLTPVISFACYSCVCLYIGSLFRSMKNHAI